MSNLPDDLVEAAARELYGMDGGKHRLEDADPIVQANYREEARRHLDLEYAVRLDGTTMPAPDVLPNQHCWCGGAVGARTPGDHLGLGCLDHVEHDWSSQRNAASERAVRIETLVASMRHEADGIAKDGVQ